MASGDLKATRVVLAIDPGKSGAVVLVGERIFEVRRDFKTEYDLVDAISALAPQATEAVIEYVGAMPGQGVTSMFNFGHWVGIARGALVASGFTLDGKTGRKYIEVVPYRWQKFYRDALGLEKGAEFDSRAIAQQWIPQAVPFLKRQKDHNTADALLLAYWRVVNPEAPSVKHT